jgi:uncharacterized LabA/DUF88 family protein
MENKKQRVIFYVDGFNFYFGLKDIRWKKYYWLDTVSFFESFLKEHQVLESVKYFSAIQKNVQKADRQDLFFSANKLNPKFKLHLGKFLQKKLICRNCKDIIIQFEEKETDVRIATQMLSDVINQKCDITVLISADSDLVPPIEAIREINPDHKIWVFFPPKRYSNDLVNLSDLYIKLERHSQRFEKLMLPEEILLKNGFILKRPKHWK